eukprot:9131113-Pyramimonas_sp.AAC.1
MGSSTLRSDCKGPASCCRNLGLASGPGNLRARAWRRAALNDNFCRASTAHVKAHTSQNDAREGAVSQFELGRNEEVGAAVKQGANFHRADASVLALLRVATRFHGLLL